MWSNANVLYNCSTTATSSGVQLRVDDAAPSLSNCCFFDSVNSNRSTSTVLLYLRVHYDGKSQEPRFTLLSFKLSCYLCFLFMFQLFQILRYIFHRVFPSQLDAEAPRANFNPDLTAFAFCPLVCGWRGSQGLLSLTLVEHLSCFRKSRDEVTR